MKSTVMAIQYSLDLFGAFVTYAMYIVSNTGLEIPQQGATNPGSNETPPTLQLAPYSSLSDVTSPDTMPLRSLLM